MTNYEKIKAMSVEEMADFLMDWAMDFMMGRAPMNVKTLLESEVEENMLPEICSCGYRFVADETICPNCGKKVEVDG